MKATTEQPVEQCIGDDVHGENLDLAFEVIREADARGWNVTIYRTTFKGFAGRWRYTAFAGDVRPASSRAKNVIAYAAAPYARWFKPSIIGEARALEELRRLMQSA